MASSASTTRRAGSTSAPTRRRSRRPRPAQPSAHQAPAGTARRRPGPPFDQLVASLVKPPALRDETLQDPRTVFQIVKRHFSRYTPEVVEQGTGCPAGHLPQGGRDDSRQLRRRPDDVVRVRRGVDAAHVRRADHRLLRSAAAAPRQRGPSRRRRHGPARPCVHSGLDRHARPSITRSTATCRRRRR